MIQLIYIIIIAYFTAGGIGFYFINRNKDPQTARKSYTKFGTYFIIINVLFFSITVEPLVFRYISAAIITGGVMELSKLFREGNFMQKGFFLSSLLIFLVLSMGFFFFSGLNENLILFSFLVISIFDSFSQITGQLWGRKKMFPAISPEKTLGGLIGGAIIAIISAFLMRDLYTGSLADLLVITIGTIIFAFAGDLGASYFKRRYHVKDYSNLIPGHGGILDRFDSLITGGAWVALFTYI
ncbi:MAG: phosphatidate cytidylyltransferase [Marinilabilia sp.]